MDRRRIYQQLGSPTPAEHDDVRATLRGMDPDIAVTLLVDLWERERERRQRLSVGVVLVAFPYIHFLLVVVLGIIPRDGLPLPLLWLVAPVLALGYFFYRQALISQRQRLLVHLMAEHDDVRLAGPLAQALRLQTVDFLLDSETRQAARDALLKILPRLQPVDAAIWDERHRAAFSKVLERFGRRTTDNPYWHDLVVELLETLARVEDPFAIPQARHLARPEHPEAIRAAAERYLATEKPPADLS